MAQRRRSMKEVGEALREHPVAADLLEMYGNGTYTLSEFVERTEALRDFLDSTLIEVEVEGLDGEREAS